MTTRSHYGQYCPLSMASEIIGSRWTILVLRELLEGSTGFNEISRGVPLMSRTLLARRLKELEVASLVTAHHGGVGKSTSYRLTPAGMALGPVLRSLAQWGQEWIAVEPSLADVDTDFLMWDIRRNAKSPKTDGSRMVVLFRFTDGPVGKTLHWLVFENGEVDLCYNDPGYVVDIEIGTNVKTMTRIWMGWLGMPDAIKEGSFQIDGPSAFTSSANTWLGLSSLAGISKRAPDLRVLRQQNPGEK